ncbi:MAG: MFS transporter [Candidatus Bathyarchaeia archaeon]
MQLPFLAPRENIEIVTGPLQPQRVNPSTLLGFLSSLHGVNHFYQLILPALLPLVVSDFRISYQQAGLLIGSFTVSYGSSQLILGRYSDRLGRRRLLTFGVVVLALTTLAAAFARGFEDLLMIQLAAGVGGSTYHPLGPPMIMDTVKAERRGFAMGVHSTGGALGSFISPFAAAAVASLFGWRGAFMGLAGVGVLIAVLYWFTNSEVKVESAQKPSYTKVLANRRLIYFIIGLSLFSAAFYGLAFFTTSFASTAYGLDIVSAAALLAALQVGGIFSAPAFGALSDRVGKPLIVFVLIAVGSVSLYALSAASVPLLAMLFIIIGMSVFGTFAVTDALVPEIVPPYLRTTAYGVYIAVVFLLTMVVSPLVGYLIDNFGFAWALATLTIIMLTAIPPLLGVFTKGAKA